MKISGIISDFLIPLWKFQGYFTMWHFMTFFSLLLHTVNNIFQKVAQMPPLWLTRPRNYKGREYLCSLRPVQSPPSPPRFLWWFGGRFISETAMVSFAQSVSFSLLASQKFSGGTLWAPTSRKKDAEEHRERCWFLLAHHNILILRIR